MANTVLISLFLYLSDITVQAALGITNVYLNQRPGPLEILLHPWFQTIPFHRAICPARILFIHQPAYGAFLGWGFLGDLKMLLVGGWKSCQ